MRRVVNPGSLLLVILGSEVGRYGPTVRQAIVETPNPVSNIHDRLRNLKPRAEPEQAGGASRRSGKSPRVASCFMQQGDEKRTGMHVIPSVGVSEEGPEFEIILAAPGAPFGERRRNGTELTRAPDDGLDLVVIAARLIRNFSLSLIFQSPGAKSQSKVQVSNHAIIERPLKR
ncbi:hypothetical protein AXG93_2116s1030 [Marchantia polymorpha subsp. ruderalis]|uniref:Uncharacterized protein n=1 Tax=Marchantia polymorpha subsp. ruderalis TaxID=1480154 RepID=A0A176VKK3_MARPO|nr:hypothetical protein AXG93_2116s1030 [Marchantia polymorpha subsp. ruderalis]